jgi:membrane protein YqaA with SNARE-associated domain
MSEKKMWNKKIYQTSLCFWRYAYGALTLWYWDSESNMFHLNKIPAILFIPWSHSYCEHKIAAYQNMDALYIYFLPLIGYVISWVAGILYLPTLFFVQIYS